MVTALGELQAQLRAILQELHENGDIQLNEAVFAPGKASLEIPCEVQVPSDNATATELRQSLLQLQEKHATLMNAAREEIEALRKALQEAHAELASAKAEATLRPCQLPPPKKKNVVTVSQLMHRWIGLAGSGTGEVVCFLKWQKILVVTCHPSGFHVSIAGNIRAVHLCIFFTG
ncbi:unnamed protein product [Cladocopium goreaui]|uniref:Uncharacterized protein n=1 Tax=Cladocopium goreaui TaxID=2562237 RepID=A0A9P1GDG3_9DINO|nr:unnamed protein product [Cladocopium goreaui]